MSNKEPFIQSEVLRTWLLETWLFKWAYRQGGVDAFPLAQKDVLETMADDLEKRANILADKKLEELLTIIDTDKLVGQKGKAIYIGGKLADDIMLANLKSEALFFTESELWKLLQANPKQLAEKAMFVDDGKLETQLLKGRAILYTLATQKKIVDLFTGI